MKLNLALGTKPVEKLIQLELMTAVVIVHVDLMLLTFNNRVKKILNA